MIKIVIICSAHESENYMTCILWVGAIAYSYIFFVHYILRA